MARRLTWIATFFACVNIPAFAADQATFIMRDGQRQSGTIASASPSGENIIGYQFHLITSGGRQVQFPVSQVAAIDFAGGTPAAAEVQQLPATSGQNYLVLRNGTGQTGKLENLLRGDTLSWITDAGQREQYPIHDVVRVYFDAPAARSAMNLPAPGASGAQPPPAGVVLGTVTVPANQNWTTTGIQVRRGQQLIFLGSGDINVAPGASSGVGGSPITPGGRLPVPNAAVGALIGRVGNGPTFLIGANTGPIMMPGNGPLLLGVNDDHYEDNTGSYTVTVRRVG